MQMCGEQPEAELWETPTGHLTRQVMHSTQHSTHCVLSNPHVMDHHHKSLSSLPLHIQSCASLPTLCASVYLVRSMAQRPSSAPLQPVHKKTLPIRGPCPAPLPLFCLLLLFREPSDSPPLVPQLVSILLFTSGVSAFALDYQPFCCHASWCDLCPRLRCHILGQTENHVDSCMHKSEIASVSLRHI